MSKPRWRWATRDHRSGEPPSRRLWTSKPMAMPRSRPMLWTGSGKRRTYDKPVSRAYCIRRFGRDLRPGKIRRLK